MATIHIETKKKMVELPIDALRNLSAIATSKGISVKKYMESILLDKAQTMERNQNPSPSNDPYFDDPHNIERIVESSKQVSEGKTVELTPELRKKLFGKL